MPSQDQLLAINTVFTAIEAVAVAVTLIYVIRQTTASRKSIQELERETSLNLLTNMRVETSEVNRLMLRDEQLAEMYGHNKTDVFAFVILHDLELKFLLHKEGITDDDIWRGDREVMADAMKREFVQSVWQRYKRQFHPDFILLIDGLLLETKSSP